MNAASDSGSAISLADFARRPRPSELSSRMIAGLLTLALGALLVLLARQEAFWMVPYQPASSQIITVLVRDEPHKKAVLPPPPFVTRFIRLRVKKPAPPVFTVASETPPAPAPLPATAAQSSPLAGGVMTAAGTGPQSISGNGTNGNGRGLSGCWDVAWAQAVRDRIGHFFYYPERAGRNHVTGWVMVHMVVRHNGRLNLVEVLKSSGNRLLDSAATDMVRKAQPLPAITERMHADRIDAVMPIAFGPAAPDNPSADSCGQ